MRTILMIHGVNLNMLGKRNPQHYGHITLCNIEELTIKEAMKHGWNLISYQSNHEGNLIDKIQLKSPDCVGIIINPGAFTHYSYALHDAIVDTNLPVIEVHLSNLNTREAWRKKSVIAPACVKVIMGKKEKGYLEAVNTLVEYIQNENKQ